MQFSSSLIQVENIIWLHEKGNAVSTLLGLSHAFITTAYKEYISIISTLQMRKVIFKTGK